MANILRLFYVFILIIKNVIKGYSFPVIISLEKLFCSAVNDELGISWNLFVIENTCKC